jgi:hypothetical protein
MRERRARGPAEPGSGGNVKNLMWFLWGIAGGFVLAHLVDKDPRGHHLLAELDARISEFTDRIGDAYRDQEARFSGNGSEGGSALSAAPGVASDAPTPKDVAEHTTVAEVHALAADADTTRLSD